MSSPFTSGRNYSMDVRTLPPPEPLPDHSANGKPPPAASDTFRFVCPACHSYLRTERRFASRQAACPSCDATFVIPAARGARQQA